MDYFTEPTVPSVYTKQETIDRKLAEVQEKQAAAAARSPFGAVTTEIVMLDGVGNAILRFGAVGGDCAAARFMEAVCASDDLWPMRHAELPEWDVNVSWFGLGIREAMQVIAADIMHYNARAAEGYKIELPVGLWHYHNFTTAPWLDPYDVLVSSAMRNQVDLPGLCRFLDIPLPLGWQHEAYARADLARQIALRGQLFRVPTALR